MRQSMKILLSTTASAPCALSSGSVASLHAAVLRVRKEQAQVPNPSLQMLMKGGGINLYL
jgi:hypothetical protein